MSAYPAAERREGSTPLSAKKRVTSTARAVESSQLEGNFALLIGMLSVWPAIWKSRLGMEPRR